jgi:hypothetical protein
MREAATDARARSTKWRRVRTATRRYKPGATADSTEDSGDSRYGPETYIRRYVGRQNRAEPALGHQEARTGYYCGNTGHFARECRLKQEDLSAEGVRLTGTRAETSRREMARERRGPGRTFRTISTEGKKGTEERR